MHNPSFVSMDDLRDRVPGVLIFYRPKRRRLKDRPFMSVTEPRWLLMINGEVVRGPLDGRFFDRREDAKVAALKLVAPASEGDPG